jgi:predicted patatin/cPLA2 family phospholipase
VKSLQNRHELYNETVFEINKLEREGKVFVIRPSLTLPAGRIERNREKLKATHERGYLDIQNRYEELIRYMEA